MAALGVFGLCQIHAFVDYLRSKLNPQQFEILFRSVISLVGFVLLSVGAVLMLTGSLRLWPLQGCFTLFPGWNLSILTLVLLWCKCL